ncbi:MAG: ABC transporter permease [Bacteroidia bacterium]
MNERKSRYLNRRLQVFKASRINKLLLILLGLWIFIAVFADLIATDQPLVVSYKGETLFPAVSALYDSHRVEFYKENESDKNIQELDLEIIDWKQVDAEWVIGALIPWNNEKPDVYNRDFVGPFDEQKIKAANGNMQVSPVRFRHYLGTDRLGRDLTAMLIHGSRISLKIGLLSAFIASLIGLLLGGISGYYGDNKLKLKRLTYLMTGMGFFAGIFWGFVSRSSSIAEGFSEGFFSSILQILISLLFIIIPSALAYLLSIYLPAGKWLQTRTNVSLDTLIQRFSELFSTMPKILVLLTLAAVFRDKSVGMVIAIIGFTSWTGISRLCRAELLRIRSLNYIEAAEVQGFKSWTILFKYALPNAMGPVIIEIAFLISGSILAESSLSFLGIGVPVEVSTWGLILSEGRQDFDAWWMVIFPGLAIFFTILLFNSFGQRLRSIRST